MSPAIAAPPADAAAASRPKKDKKKKRDGGGAAKAERAAAEAPAPSPGGIASPPADDRDAPDAAGPGVVAPGTRCVRKKKGGGKEGRRDGG
jgi:hypothetical protein